MRRRQRVVCQCDTMAGAIVSPILLRMRTLILGLVAVFSLLGQTGTEEFRVYTNHPRLFLRPQRLRLLKRERERQTI